MKVPVCSLIIPSYRSSDTIAACLASLREQLFDHPFEVIVVDSSADGTAELVRRDFPEVRLIHLPRQCDPARARNIGASQARGEILAFIDADCIAPPTWLRQLYDRLQEGVDGVGGAIANGNGESPVSWAGYFCEFREFLPGGAARDVENLTLGNAAYRRDAFWAVGGLPVESFPQEDQPFHASLRRQGFRLRLDPAIYVFHRHRTAITDFLHHQRCIGRANARVLQQLKRPGSALVRRPGLLACLLPGVITWRFLRTAHACHRVGRGLFWRRPAVVAACWLGMCWWGYGFLEGARHASPWTLVRQGA